MLAGCCFMLCALVQWGWQPIADGGREYIVQVEPQLADLDSFRKDGFSSDIPPTLRDVRRIRIVVGSDPLPNQGEIPAAPAPLPANVSAAPLSGPRPPLDARAGKVSLANGHQPADAASHESEPDAKSEAPTPEHRPSRSPSERPAEEPAAAATATPARPWLTLLFVTGGLIVSLSGNIFLGWIHWGTRNQYRAVVSQLRGKRNDD